MNIEKLSSSDLEQVKQILEDAGLPLVDLTAAHMGHFMGARLKTGELAGVIGLEVYERAGLLRSLAIREEYRGRGIAGELINTLHAYALSAGIGDLYLLTTTAEGYFARHGFEPFDRQKVPVPVGESAEFRSLCPDTAVCMRKRIGSQLG